MVISEWEAEGLTSWERSDSYPLSSKSIKEGKKKEAGESLDILSCIVQPCLQVHIPVVLTQFKILLLCVRQNSL